MKKIRTKMIMLILLPTILFFMGTVIFITITVSNMATEEADRMLNAQGEAISNEIRIQLETVLNSAEAISASVSGLIENGAEPTREEVNYMLQRLLDMNPGYLTAWMYWEPNAFDGKDEEFVNTEGHDHTGRFIPMWSKNDAGDYVVEAITGYDVEGDVVQQTFEKVLSTGEKVIFEPLIYEVDGEMVLMTPVTVPININGKTVGIVGIDISLDAIHEFVSQYRFYNTGFAGLMTSIGGVVSHQNEELIGENYFESSGVKNNRDIEKVKQAVENGEFAKMEGFSNELQTDVYRLFIPVHISGVDQPWTTFLAAPIDEVMKTPNLIRNIIIAVGLFITVVLTSIILLVTRSIVQPIERVEAQMNYISAGDLSKEPLEVKTKDETGRLARALNTMQEELKKMISNITLASTSMASQSEELNQAANEVSTGSEQMTKTMEELAIGAETQANRASDIATMVSEYVTKIEKVNQDATNIQQSSRQVLEMTEQGRTLMDTSTKQMETIDKIVQYAVEKVEGLDRQSQQISELVAVIQVIAEQTNLLALNAAIEAARAGEHGAGFAVVADEVRKLAEKSSESVVDITNIVEQIQSEASFVAESLRQGYDEVTTGIDHIHTTGEMFYEISNRVTNVGTSIDEISIVLEEIAKNSQEINNSIEDIAAVSEQSAAGVEQSTATTEETSAAMEEVARSSNELAGLADELNNIVKQFKV